MIQMKNQTIEDNVIIKNEYWKRQLNTFETDIMLVVRVPVLSLQITVVQPNVSTDGNDLTIAFKRAIRLVPRARHLKTLQGKVQAVSLVRMTSCI